VIAVENPTTEMLAGAVAYVDLSGCAGGTPSSTTLIAGQPAPTSGGFVTEGGSSVTINGEAAGIALPGWAAVAVTTIDRARNESVLSNVVCVQRVAVRGFWDDYCAEHGLAPEDCRENYSCAVSAPGSDRRAAGGALALLGLTAIALVLRRRRDGGRS
jgi:MYXO-CTERM domain-containing protein